MKVKQLNKNRYKEWDEFCLESEDAWFWHTSNWIEYMLERKKAQDPVSKSFMVSLDGNIIAIVPLIYLKKSKQFTSNTPHCISPAFASLPNNLKHKVEKFVYNYIELLVKKLGANKIIFKNTTLANSFIYSQLPPGNMLFERGYTINCINTYVINLTHNLERLKLNMNHGHKAMINASESFGLTTVYLAKDNITKEIFQEYMDMHKASAGIVTRPIKTFKMCFDFIKQGRAILVGCKHKGKYVGFSYFQLYKHKAYYGSSATNKNQKNLSIGGYIIWQTIKYLKSHNYTLLELGYLEGNGNKCHSIMKFKRNFGGIAMPLFIARKRI